MIRGLWFYIDQMLSINMYLSYIFIFLGGGDGGDGCITTYY